MTLKTPLRIQESPTSANAPMIVDAEGKSICSFGNMMRYRGRDWCNKAAIQIVASVNGSHYTHLMIVENKRLKAEVERLKAEIERLSAPPGEATTSRPG